MFSIFYPQKGFEWHHEDAWLASEKYPIFAVADGVTLLATMYPDEGPKVIAEIFCHETVKFLEKNFAVTSEKTITEAYQQANNMAGDYNRQRGELFNYAAVAVLALVKNGKVLASRLTDCGLALIRNGQLIFKTPEFWSEMKKTRREGYGIINGQPDLEKYLDFYTLDYKTGDWLVLFSDGFENHFTDTKFVSLFTGNDIEKVRQSIALVDSRLVDSDNDKYGHERTILAIRLEK